MQEYDRLRLRVWRRCFNCDRLMSEIVIAGNSIVQNFRYSSHTCAKPTEAQPYCHMQQEGEYELCTGRQDSDETLIFAGDRLSTDGGQTWAEVTWWTNKAQWSAGSTPLWKALELGAKVVGNSHDQAQEGRKPHE